MIGKFTKRRKVIGRADREVRHQLAVDPDLELVRERRLVVADRGARRADVARVVQIEAREVRQAGVDQVVEARSQSGLDFGRVGDLVAVGVDDVIEVDTAVADDRHEGRGRRVHLRRERRVAGARQGLAGAVERVGHADARRDAVPDHDVLRVLARQVGQQCRQQRVAGLREADDRGGLTVPADAEVRGQAVRRPGVADVGVLVDGARRRRVAPGQDVGFDVRIADASR